MNDIPSPHTPSRPRAPSWLPGLLALTLGVLSGLGAFTFIYAEGPSYLSDDPKVCLNCHVMREAYDDWHHSSHTAAAVCQDCHAPKDFLAKWATKGINGWNHALAFSTGNFPDPIRITGMNARIVQANCVYCHQMMVSQIHGAGAGQERYCVDCHGNVGHGW